MSKGGSGDSLTGVITGLIAQGVNVYDACCLGAYINGKAGEIAEKKTSKYSVLPLTFRTALEMFKRTKRKFIEN